MDDWPSDSAHAEIGQVKAMQASVICCIARASYFPIVRKDSATCGIDALHRTINFVMMNGGNRQWTRSSRRP